MVLFALISVIQANMCILKIIYESLLNFLNTQVTLNNNQRDVLIFIHKLQLVIFKRKNLSLVILQILVLLFYQKFFLFWPEEYGEDDCHSLKAHLLLDEWTV